MWWFPTLLAKSLSSAAGLPDPVELAGRALYPARRPPTPAAHPTPVPHCLGDCGPCPASARPCPQAT